VLLSGPTIGPPSESKGEVYNGGNIQDFLQDSRGDHDSQRRGKEGRVGRECPTDRPQK